MYELSADNVAEYLRSSGRVGVDETIVARELAGGVSNLVLLVEIPARGEHALGHVAVLLGNFQRDRHAG